MTRKKIECPLCLRHEIDEKHLSVYLTLPGNRILEMTTVFTAVCPGVRKEMEECPRLAHTFLGSGFSVSLYKINDGFRFVFHLKFHWRDQIIRDCRAGVLYTLDEALTALEKLKIAALTQRLAALKAAPDMKIDKDRLALSIVNRQLKPFFTALRAERKIGKIEAITK